MGIVAEVAVHPHRVPTYCGTTIDEGEKYIPYSDFYCLAASLFPLCVSLSLCSISLRERCGGGLSMFVSQEAPHMRTTGLASPVVSVEIKRTITEAQQTLMLPHSR